MKMSLVELSKGERSVLIESDDHAGKRRDTKLLVDLDTERTFGREVQMAYRYAGNS